MKALKIVAVAAVVAIIGTLALELRETKYELRQQQEANRNWEDTADFQNSNHIAVTAAQRSEIARLQQAQTNVIAAH